MHCNFYSTGNGWLGTPFPTMCGWELEVPHKLKLHGYALRNADLNSEKVTSRLIKTKMIINGIKLSSKKQRLANAYSTNYVNFPILGVCISEIIK